MHVATYLELLREAERALATSYRHVAQGHAAEIDVPATCTLLAGECDDHVAALAPLVRRYPADPAEAPERLHAPSLPGTRTGGVGLLRDLQDLHALCSFVDTTWTLIGQAARGLRDGELLGVVERCEPRTTIQLAWLVTRMMAAAPQALLIDPPVLG